MPITAGLVGPTGAELNNQSIANLAAGFDTYRQAKEYDLQQTWDRIFKMAEKSGLPPQAWAATAEGKKFYKNAFDKWGVNGEQLADQIAKAPMDMEKTKATFDSFLLTGKLQEKGQEILKDAGVRPQETSLPAPQAQASPPVEAVPPEAGASAPPPQPSSAPSKPAPGTVSVGVGMAGVPSLGPQNPLAENGGRPAGVRSLEAPAGSMDARKRIEAAATLPSMGDGYRRLYNANLPKFLNAEFSPDELYKLGVQYGEARNYGAAQAAFDAYDIMTGKGVSSRANAVLPQRQKEEIWNKFNPPQKPAGAAPAAPAEPTKAAPAASEPTAEQKLREAVKKQFPDRAAEIDKTSFQVLQVNNPNTWKAIQEGKPTAAASTVPVPSNPGQVKTAVEQIIPDKDPAAKRAEAFEAKQTSDAAISGIRRYVVQKGPSAAEGDNQGFMEQMRYAAQKLQDQDPETNYADETFMLLRSKPLDERQRILAEINQAKAAANLNNANAEYTKWKLDIEKAQLEDTDAAAYQAMVQMGKDPEVQAFGKMLEQMAEKDPKNYPELAEKAIQQAIARSPKIAAWNNINNAWYSKTLGYPTAWDTYKVRVKGAWFWATDKEVTSLKLAEPAAGPAAAGASKPTSAGAAYADSLSK